MHTRFEHSLGVVHVATKMFDALTENSREFLRSEMHFTDDALRRDRMLVRLAALLHDVGHSPFSHASKVLFSKIDEVQRGHEDCSAEFIRRILNDVINSHPACS